MQKTTTRDMIIQTVLKPKVKSLLALSSPFD